jgi:transposase
MLMLMAKAAEWTKRVAEWRASGLKAQDFCVDRDYSAKSLWHWSSKLGRAAEEHHARKPAVRLVRVARQTAVPQLSASGIIMELAGAKLTLQGQVDAVALRTVVMTLRELGLQDAQ